MKFLTGTLLALCLIQCSTATFRSIKSRVGTAVKESIDVAKEIKGRVDHPFAAIMKDLRDITVHEAKELKDFTGLTADDAKIVFQEATSVAAEHAPAFVREVVSSSGPLADLAGAVASEVIDHAEFEACVVEGLGESVVEGAPETARSKVFEVFHAVKDVVKTADEAKDLVEEGARCFEKCTPGELKNLAKKGYNFAKDVAQRTKDNAETIGTSEESLEWETLQRSVKNGVKNVSSCVRDKVLRRH